MPDLGPKTFSRLALPAVILRRVGRCIQFGCGPDELRLAVGIVAPLAERGRSSVMGYIGFQPVTQAQTQTLRRAKSRARAAQTSYGGDGTRGGPGAETIKTGSIPPSARIARHDVDFLAGTSTRQGVLSPLLADGSTRLARICYNSLYLNAVCAQNFGNPAGMPS